jgi:hypothetical protein
MSNWLLNLPVLWMALIIVAAIYLALPFFSSSRGSL